MKYTFVAYPKCTTCQKAAKWLTQHGIAFEARDIVLNNPTSDELQQWMAVSGRPTTKFFNTSGLRYKALNMKDVVKQAPEAELLSALASEGMLVKRPILIARDKVLVGFNEKEWAEALLK